MKALDPGFVDQMAENASPADVGEFVTVKILDTSFLFFGCGVWVRIGLCGHGVAECGLGHGSLLDVAMQAELKTKTCLNCIIRARTNKMDETRIVLRNHP